MALECHNKKEKTKEKKITYFYSRSSLTKEKIFNLLKHNFESLNNCKNINLYDDKGILITDDADLYFLKDTKILFFTKNNEEFNTSNLLRLFNLIKKIGEGGFGEVYLAKQKMTNKYYTIKFLNYDINNIKDLNSFYKEIDILRRLNHPQIIKLYSYCISKENKIAIIMEYLSGGTLKKYIMEHKNQKLDENESKNILRQILEIISYCHLKNVIHHDLKPDNILFIDESHTLIKIIDFGISSIINEKSTGGSLEYLPPEIITYKNDKSSPSVDIWSIGCIFGEMIKGESLFIGENIKEIKKQILDGKIELPKNISNFACDLLKKMLNFEPDKRITADEALLHPFFNKDNLIMDNEKIGKEDFILNDFNKIDNIYNNIKTENNGENKKIKDETLFITININNKKLYIKNKNIFKMNNRQKKYKFILSKENSKKILFNNILNENEQFSQKNNISPNTTRNKYDEKKFNLSIKLKNINNDNSILNSNFHTTNNSLIKEKNLFKKKQNRINEEEKNEHIDINTKNKTITNFISRENMARNRLSYNIKKLENYKSELVQFKTSRYSYGHPKNKEIEKDFKYIPDFHTKINNNSNDELLSYWIKLTNNFYKEVPNYMKPIGLSREQKQKIEKFAKSLEKKGKINFSYKTIGKDKLNKKINNSNISKNYITSYNFINNDIKARKIKLLNNNNKIKSSIYGKLILPNLVNINSNKKI